MEEYKTSPIKALCCRRALNRVIMRRLEEGQAVHRFWMAVLYDPNKHGNAMDYRIYHRIPASIFYKFRGQLK